MIYLSMFSLDKEKFIESEFGNTELSDERLNKRLLKVAGKMIQDPKNSIPGLMGGDIPELKGFYSRLSKKKDLRHIFFTEIWTFS
jgi:hypothetical protein